MSKYIVKKSEIEAMKGLFKQHFLNPQAQSDKSLDDLTGISGFGFHIIEVPPGKESTEYHVHYYEDECVYILSGTGKVIIGEDESEIVEGDFIGYRAGGKAHTMIRAAEINNCPKIAPDFGSDSRRGKGRIIVLCNPCRDTEAGSKDKQNWMIICFRGPKYRRNRSDVHCCRSTVEP